MSGLKDNLGFFRLLCPTLVGLLAVVLYDTWLHAIVLFCSGIRQQLWNNFWPKGRQRTRVGTLLVDY